MNGVQVFRFIALTGIGIKFIKINDFDIQKRKKMNGMDIK